jgi:hypothetical protein
MDVLDHTMGSFWIVHVVVLARPGLPEATIGSTSISNGKPFQESRTAFHKICNRSLPDRPLDVGEYGFNLRAVGGWKYEQVNVFRHDHPGPKLKAVFFTSGFEGLDEPFSCAVLAQQGESAKAGKRKKMGVAWKIEVTHLFAMLLK